MFPPKHSKKIKTKRRAKVLDTEQKQQLIEWLERFHFMSQHTAAEQLGISVASIVETRVEDKDFDKKIRYLQTKTYNTVRNALVDLATGQACKITVEYKTQFDRTTHEPILDENGNPVMMKVAERIVKDKPDPQAVIYCLEKLGDPDSDEALSPDELRLRLLEQIESMPKPTSGSYSTSKQPLSGTVGPVLIDNQEPTPEPNETPEQSPSDGTSPNCENNGSCEGS